MSVGCTVPREGSSLQACLSYIDHPDLNCTTQPSLSDEKAAVVELLLLELQGKGVTPIFISLGGSRIKGLASPDSDFDVNAVVLQRPDKYLLQTASSNEKINLDGSNGLKVEGQFIDYLKAMDWILNGNMATYTIFGGETLFTTPLGEKLLSVYRNVYQKQNLFGQLRGMLKGYIYRKLAEENVTSKDLMEAVYLCIKLTLMKNSGDDSTGNTPPPFDINEMLSSDTLTGVMKDHGGWVLDLIEARIADKDAQCEIPSQFKDLQEQVIKLEMPKAEHRNLIQERVLLKQLFLDVVQYPNEPL